MPQQPDPCVLIVDDDPGIREAIAEGLETHGYRTLAASDGLAALPVASGQPAPDLILLDLMMPRMNGLEFLQVCQQHKVLREIPVIVISANPRVSEILPFAQVKEILRKPLDLQVLLTSIGRAFAPPAHP